MKSKIHSLSESFKPVILYRDDIEAILAILYEVSETVGMSSDEHVFNSDEEWLEIKTNYFTHLEINSARPYISIELKEGYTRLYVGDDAAASRGAYEKIKEILRTRSRKAFSRSVQWTSSILSILCVFAVGYSFKSWTHIVALGILSILWAALQVRNSRIENQKHSIVFPKYRSESPRFWQRNSDNIIIAVTAAIIGAVIGSIVTALVK